MNQASALLEWFHNEVLPDVTKDASIVVGGTSLLREFLTIPASTPEGGQISIAVPFVGPGFATMLAAWELMPHARIDIVLVTAGQADARRGWNEIGRLPWRSVIIAVCRRLHAKVYAFVPPSGAAACLIGSHNLTRAAAARNHEAGVLLLASRDPQVAAIVSACQERVMQLMRAGKTYIDTYGCHGGRAA